MLQIPHQKTLYHPNSHIHWTLQLKREVVEETLLLFCLFRRLQIQEIHNRLIALGWVIRFESLVHI
jgi:hypothetical protein